ncbi:rust resistance kinase Lr10-like [Senna tora]|uniref:Rust resistance kinase Lr10-like n=1 Tax=Senna tora TaxID=362788 RepID=A0A834T9H3_9FABA|nr:rust resistance kinase Lr10-like [Senna tora]
MDTSIVNSFFYICLMLIVVFAEHVGSWNNNNNNRCSQPQTTCGNLPIRFPFRIIGRQPPECGYPGFALQCSTTNHTVLELPRSVKLHVISIDYKSQTLHLSDPHACLFSYLPHFTLFASPFHFNSPYLSNYTFFNCSLPRYTNLDTKLFDASSIPSDFLGEDNILHLMWSDPTHCKLCESKGQICGFKNSIPSNETTCFGHLHKGSSTKLIITGSFLGSVFVLLVTAAAFYYVYNSHKSWKENRAIIEKFLKDYRALKPTRYSYAEIKRITHQFGNKLGQGSYGTVFKGNISTQLTVAVKILTNSEGNGEEFINEVGTMGRIHHVNIVRLIGFCADGFRRALVYEFLPNGSLQNFINSPNNRENFLGWEKLQEIALGIAKGIEYLHQGCDQRILHFDIKPHNVLLDNDFTPKICDFGLAKLCSKDQSIVSMTAARGTMGYIAPEVFSRNFGNVSHKSDVYSFGMLLLETIGGRKITEDTKENISHINYPEWIYNILEEREDVRINIEDERDTKIAKKLATVGLWCIQWHAVDRPSMQSVVHMLEGAGDKLPVPPNPFDSNEGPSTRKNTSVPQRHLIHGLEIIHEVE